MNTQRLTAFVCAIAIAAIPLQVRADSTSELLYAMRNTFTQDFTVSGSGDLSVVIDSEPLVNGEFQYQAMQNGGDLHSLDNYDFSFDTDALKKSLDPAIPSVAGTLAFGSESYFRHEDEMLWGKFKNPLLDITRAETPQIKQIAEGSAEILKFFADRYVTLNLNEVIALFAGDTEEMQMIRAQFEALRNVYADYGNLTTDMFAGLLAAKLFDITKDNGAIVLTLTQKPENIELEQLAPVLETLGMPGFGGGVLADDLQSYNDQLKAEWGVILETVDLELKFRTDSGKITLINCFLKMKGDAPTTIGEEASTLPVSFDLSVSGVVEGRSSRISFPQEMGINFNKVMEMFKALVQMTPSIEMDAIPAEPVEESEQEES